MPYVTQLEKKQQIISEKKKTIPNDEIELNGKRGASLGPYP